jgi:hypothetical protein
MNLLASPTAIAPGATRAATHIALLSAHQRDHPATQPERKRVQHMHHEIRHSISLARGLKLGAASAAALLALAPAAGVSRAAGPSARAAGSFSLNEGAHLHLTSKHGFTLNEQGYAWGTVPGSIYVHLTIASTSRVTAELNIYPRGGSITGYAGAGYHRGSQSASFYGSISIGRGTGRYSRARGSGLTFWGSIQRSNDAITVFVRGGVSD